MADAQQLLQFLGNRCRPARARPARTGLRPRQEHEGRRRLDVRDHCGGRALAERPRPHRGRRHRARTHRLPVRHASCRIRQRRPRRLQQQLGRVRPDIGRIHGSQRLDHVPAGSIDRDRCLSPGCRRERHAGLSGLQGRSAGARGAGHDDHADDEFRDADDTTTPTTTTPTTTTPTTTTPTTTTPSNGSGTAGGGTSQPSKGGKTSAPQPTTSGPSGAAAPSAGAASTGGAVAAAAARARRPRRHRRTPSSPRPPLGRS